MKNNNDYYHFTNYNSIDSISKCGLMPNTGIRCMTKLDNRCGVFLSKGLTNSISMYASILSFYDLYKNNGIQKIDECFQKINYYENLKLKLDTNGETIIDKEISQINKEMQVINYIMNTPTFIDYLGGAGCLLKINGLEDFASESLEDCCYNNIIPPEKISVVVLINNISYDIIDSRELIVSYLLNTTSYNILLDTIKDQNMLNNLYRYISQYNRNFYGYEINEVALTSYNYKCKKIKPLIFN